MGRWDLRWLFVRKYAGDRKAEAEKELLPPDSVYPHAFTLTRVQPNPKEGGMLVHFSYSGDIQEAVNVIREHLEDHEFRPLLTWGKVRAFLVKGRPFVEDIVRSVPASRLKVEFNGPELSTEILYKEFRPFGKIVEIIPANPLSKDTLKSASIYFSRLRGATSARNCMHGAKFGNTELSLGYESQMVKKREEICFKSEIFKKNDFICFHLFLF